MASSMTNAFVNLVNKYGENGVLNVFFANIGVELDGSTIDKIEVIGNGTNVCFYYNANTNDYDTIGAFSEDALALFLTELEDELEERDEEDKRSYIEEVIDTKMKDIITDAHDRSAFVENIIDSIITDIEECADEEWNDSDIDIALARVLVNGVY